MSEVAIKIAGRLYPIREGQFAAFGLPPGPESREHTRQMEETARRGEEIRLLEEESRRQADTAAQLRRARSERRKELNTQRKEKMEQEGFVYIIQFSDRVKIGFSLYPQKRIKSLPHDRVLAVFSGGPKKEADIHQMFSSLRIKAGSCEEWFVSSPELLEFAERMGINYTNERALL